MATDDGCIEDDDYGDVLAAVDRYNPKKNVLA